MAGKSQSTVTNYGHHLAKLALNFNELPTEVDPDRTNDYLHLVKRGHSAPSDSYFKFTVYALRFAYRIEPAHVGTNAQPSSQSALHRD